jgi:hypothetical protein
MGIHPRPHQEEVITGEAMDPTAIFEAICKTIDNATLEFEPGQEDKANDLEREFYKTMLSNFFEYLDKYVVHVQGGDNGLLASKIIARTVTSLCINILHNACRLVPEEYQGSAYQKAHLAALVQLVHGYLGSAAKTLLSGKDTETNPNFQ